MTEFNLSSPRSVPLKNEQVNSAYMYVVQASNVLFFL